ncbi:hypothetical protein SDJN03_29247, partial [Cucurbita argyrosperma subsp. sororia]
MKNRKLRMDMDMSTVTATSSVVLCVAKDGADPVKLQRALNWASDLGGTNCCPGLVVRLELGLDHPAIFLTVIEKKKG